MFKRMISYLGSFLDLTRPIIKTSIINITYVFVYVYIYTSNLCMNIFTFFAPEIILLKCVTHNDITCNESFKVYEYMYNQKNNNKLYRFKYIEDNKTMFDLYNIHENINMMKKINHCCILDKDDEYIRDITDDIKKFAHLDGCIEWKYIFIHLDIHNEHCILINLNDDDLSSKKITIDLNEIFTLS